MSLGNQNERVKGWVSKALDLMEYEKPAFYQKALPIVEKIWAENRELEGTFGPPSSFLRKIAEENMLNSVGLLSNGQPGTIHESIRTLSGGEIYAAGQITGKEAPIADGITYSSYWHDLRDFSKSAGSYFYKDKRPEFIEADRAKLTARFNVGRNNSSIARGAAPKTDNP